MSDAPTPTGEATDVERLVERLREVADTPTDRTLIVEYRRSLREAADTLARLTRERDEARAALEKLFPVEEGFTDAFDGLEAAGLLVAVPADEAFRDEWDADEMYVWAWSPLAARRALEPERGEP